MHEAVFLQDKESLYRIQDNLEKVRKMMKAV